MEEDSSRKVLLVEPFYGGSHKQLIDLIHQKIPECTLVTMTAKKWHWRARTSALHLAQVIPTHESYRTLFCSSVLNLAELVALRPDIAKMKKVVYIHENQLVYPVRKAKDTDFQYGYNQILTCLTADAILFNSTFNQESFLKSIPSFLKLMPDYRPKHLPDQIRQKCHVVYFPMNFKEIDSIMSGKDDSSYCGICDDNKNCSSWNSQEGKNVMEQSHESDDFQNETISPSPKAEVKGTKHLIRQSLFHNDGVDFDRSICDDCIPNKVRRESSEIQRLERGDENCDTNTQNLNFDAGTSSKDICMSAPKDDGLCDGTEGKEGPLHIAWAHRWEHDKDPETFLNTMIKLHNEGVDFRLSVLGEQFTYVPDIFPKAKEVLSSKVLHWGYVESKAEYYRVLQKSDVAVSTSLHEFFGVSMLEAVYLGCYPLCPNRLVYPEIYHKCYLYNTEVQLYKKLKHLAKCPYIVRNHTLQMDVSKYCYRRILPEIAKFING